MFRRRRFFWGCRRRRMRREVGLFRWRN
ncbi:hypothetical protein LINPERHAP2_LOCUS21467 [Linum perenne]